VLRAASELTECKGIKLGTSIEKLDLEVAIHDRLPLTD
jgi:hypothetical protein